MHSISQSLKVTGGDIPTLHQCFLFKEKMQGCKVPSPKILELHKAAWGVCFSVHSRSHCITFCSSVSPLQIMLSFACSRSNQKPPPRHELPGCSNSQWGILASYLLGWGRTPTCNARQNEVQYTSLGTPWKLQEKIFPNSRIALVCVCVCVCLGARSQAQTFDLHKAAGVVHFGTQVEVLALHADPVSHHCK